MIANRDKNIIRITLAINEAIRIKNTLEYALADYANANANANEDEDEDEDDSDVILLNLIKEVLQQIKKRRRH